MPESPGTIGAIIGSTLMALLLTGSSRTAADSPLNFLTFEYSEARVLSSEASALYARGQYTEARAAFRSVARRAQYAGIARLAAMNWNNAGVCSLVESQFRVALEDFRKARQIAELEHEDFALSLTLNNLASLYIHMGQPDLALRVASEALAGPAVRANPEARAKLLLQQAGALAELDRLPEAEPVYRRAIAALIDRKDLYATAVTWGQFGYEYLKAKRFEDAERALSEALLLMRANNFRISASVLSGLAQLKGRAGDRPAAEALFLTALALPPNITPRNQVYMDRGQFRLASGDLPGALADFRQARHIMSAMRADIVPADQDRVALESSLGPMYEGLIDAGNRLARVTGGKTILRETFDAAEQDRLWSLRALIPSPNDWRTKLPERYWELLARYQALVRTAMSRTSPELERDTGVLRLELQQIEAGAAGPPAGESPQSPLAHVERILDDDTVLLSFHVSKTSSWIWAVDRHHADVCALPPLKEIQTLVGAFGRALRSGTSAGKTGAKLYRDLFGAVPAAYLRHKRWLLEPDGPLYELPFAALVVDEARGPTYLVERAELQLLPDALLAERDRIPADGEFLGIGDPVYNPADSRYRGTRAVPELLLARLPNTSPEVEACARAWNSPRPRLLLGLEAELDRVRSAVESKPAIIHFATHVVTAPGDFRSGLIALSLNAAGEMGLLGPKEIVARPVSAKLVVMDGCHSAQGEALPSAGLMGLTRAWIGAGAMAVLATRWNVPDGEAQPLMEDFYRALRVAPHRGPAHALREAQLTALQNPRARQFPAPWAGYFLLSRML